MDLGSIYRFSEDARRIIRNVFNFCKAEKVRGTPIAFNQSSVRAAAMTGVSRASLYRVVREHDNPPAPRTLPQRSQKLQLDSFDEGVIRRTINSMYSVKRILPTLSNVQEELKDAIGYKGSRESIRHLLKKLGFYYKRCQTNRTLLMEREDILCQRIRYLRTIRKYRQTGRYVVYIDETYVHSNHSVAKCWQDHDTGLKIPFSKGLYCELFLKLKIMLKI